MKRVLFTHSYFLRFDRKQWETGQPYPPLGTLYAAALLREKEYSVSVFDTMFSRHANEIEDQIVNNNPDFLVIYDDGFNYLTKMCLTNMREAAFEMIRLGKEKGCTVIVSSSDSTDHYQEYLQKGADFILLGEAEITLFELLDSISNNEDVLQIQGLALIRDNNCFKTQRRSVLTDLDILPLPAWDLIDIEPYRRTWLSHNGYFSLNMSTTRGCPFKCNWCAKPIYGNRYNSRSPQHVVQELQMLSERYHFDHIWFCDDIFGLKPGWVSQFADLVRREKLNFRFKIQSRADLLAQENAVVALARAGCEEVWIGAESGSQKILDAMDKGITINQIHTATQLLKKHHIKPAFFIQFGYPGETKDDITLTIEMINELLPDEIGISVSYPLPGTSFYEKVKSELQKKANWTDSDELMLMFQNTYQPLFYKQLHRYVHQSYRKHLALKSLADLVAHPLKSNYRSVKKALSAFYHVPSAFLQKFKLQQLEKVS